MEREETTGGVVDATGAPVSARHPDLQKLLAYWHKKRDDHDFPRRADMDPIDLRFMLERIALIEIHEGDERRYRIRLVGSWWRQLHGFDSTGLWLEDWPNPGQLQLVIASYEALIALRQPLLVMRNNWVDERSLNYEAMLLPLSEDRARISMIVAGIGPS